MQNGFIKITAAFVIGLAAGIMLDANMAHAADASAKPLTCGSVDAIKQSAATRGGKWVDLDHDQWEFARGVSIMHPYTPEGFQIGDRAAMVMFDDPDNDIVVFMDGDRASCPMIFTAPLVKAIQSLGDVRHAGEGT